MADPTFGISQYQHLFPSPNYQLQLFAPTTRTGVELRLLAENFSHDQKKRAASPVDLNRLSSGLLHAFLVVAEVGKISEAARQLHFSQPAVTAQIRRLRLTWTYPCSFRSAHGVTLTPRGTHLRERFSAFSPTWKRYLPK
jgi:hypothetical protein